MKKKMFFLFFILLAGSLFYSFIHPGHVIAFIDAAFIIGLFFFLVGAGLLVFEKGFFNGLAFGFKQLRKSSKEGAYTAQFDHLDDTSELHQEYNTRKPMAWTAPFLTIGGAAALLTLIFSYFLSS